MNEIMHYIGFLIPVFIMELVLMIVALVHILRHEHFKMGNKIIWIIVSVFIGIIGPILYFTLGRSED